MCVCYVYGLKHVIPLICVFKQTKITSEKEWFFGKIIKKFQFMCKHTDTWHTHNVHPSSFKQIQANWNYHIKQIYWIILLVHTQIHTREHIKRESETWSMETLRLLSEMLYHSHGIPCAHTWYLFCVSGSFFFFFCVAWWSFLLLLLPFGSTKWTRFHEYTSHLVDFRVCMYSCFHARRTFGAWIH